jgi:hypothetical protein
VARGMAKNLVFTLSVYLLHKPTNVAMSGVIKTDVAMSGVI